MLADTRVTLSKDAVGPGETVVLTIDTDQPVASPDLSPLRADFGIGNIDSSRRVGFDGQGVRTSQQIRIELKPLRSGMLAILPLAEDRELVLLSTEPRALIFHTSLLLPKATRSTQGVAVMTLKPKYQLQRVCTPEESGIVNLPRYRARSIPGTGALLRPEDRGEEQLTLL